MYINRHGIGPVDLIATKEGEIKLFDVKCESYRSSDGSKIARSLTSEQKKLNVKIDKGGFSGSNSGWLWHLPSEISPEDS